MPCPLLHFTLDPRKQRFVARKIAKAILARTHPITSECDFSHFTAIWSHRRFIRCCACHSPSLSIFAKCRTVLTSYPTVPGLYQDCTVFPCCSCFSHPRATRMSKQATFPYSSTYLYFKLWFLRDAHVQDIHE